jgi:hypothetical protein
VALVEVVGVQVEVERAQQPDAAEAQHQFLAEAVGLVAAVETMRERAALGVILVEVGVQQQDRDPMPVRAGIDIEPGAHPDRTRRHFHRDHGVLGRVPPVRRLDLAALGVELLAEVAGAADQRDEDDRQQQIRAGAHGVAGQHAEAARVRVHLRPDRDLHREIGDARACQKRLDG